MALLVDLFGYLGIVLHGLTITAQSVAVGGVLFLVAVARPFAARPGASAAAGAAPVLDALAVSGFAQGSGRGALAMPAGLSVRRATARIAGCGALALALCEGLNVLMQSAVLVTTVDITWLDALGANYAEAGLVKVACGLLLALLLLAPARLFGRTLGRAPGAALLGLAAVELAAATMTTHAAARLDDNALLLGMEFLHQLGAAIWVGGMPCFLVALARVRDAEGLARIGPAFSRISLAGVGCILLSGVTMSLFYIGSWEGVYGTAYGVMVGAKVVMFGMLLLLGLGNFLVTERMRRGAGCDGARRRGGQGGASVLRMRRFAEVELGIGITIFFTAASLTSVPPAVDLTQDRVTWHEIVERNTPVWPRLASPDHDRLGIPALQAQLDAEAAAQARKPLPAFVEGSGTLPPRNADDIAWSEYNHHWSGLFLLAIGLLALLERAGARWARHWPLVFVGLAGFLLIRSDPEVWPLGDIGWFAAFADVEVVQHRMFVVVVAIFGIFEWMVRTGRLRRPGFALVFPLMCAGGSALLFTHSHAIANVKDQLLIELTHTPVALLGIAAGWSRWLQLRLPPGPTTRVAGWVWPVAFVLIGVLLVLYREA